MKTARVIFRAVALSVVTCAIYLLWLMGAPFVWPFKRARDNWRSFIFHTWAKAMARLVNLKIEVQGNVPQGAFFLVSNHLSYLDVVVYAALLDCVFIAKRDVAHWPVIGRMCRSMGTIFIDREKRRDTARVNALIEPIWAQGRGVLLFPEGTSTQGATVLPFNSSLLEPAARAGFPVSYAALSYSVPDDQQPAYLSVCWWGDMTFIGHLLEMLELREIRARVAFGAETIQFDNRKALAVQLHSAVKREFIPMPQAGEECNAVTS
jgi:1-acyl-sn-glycerol-3-phosphate acyltransferase